MKIAIIGAGNMGGSIARGLAKGTIVKVEDICVANPTLGKLNALKAEFPAIQTTCSNVEAAKCADIVLLAVKPWLVESVIKELSLDAENQILVSVAAGITFAQLEECVGGQMAIFRIIPNTAISQLESMTLIAGHRATCEQSQLMVDIFNEMDKNKTKIQLVQDEKENLISLISAEEIHCQFQTQMISMVNSFKLLRNNTNFTKTPRK